MQIRTSSTTTIAEESSGSGNRSGQTQAPPPPPPPAIPQFKTVDNSLACFETTPPAFASTKTNDGNIWIFYYLGNSDIAYLEGNATSGYSQKKVLVKNSEGHFDTVKGLKNTPLAATTWDGSLRLFYIDSNQIIQELCLHEHWFYGMFSDMKYKASKNSVLYATGNAADEHGRGNISVFFMDDEDKKLTQATIGFGHNYWESKVVTI